MPRVRIEELERDGLYKAIEISELLGMTDVSVANLVKRGVLEGRKNEGGEGKSGSPWMIKGSSILNLARKMGLFEEVELIGAAGAQKILGCSRKSVTRFIKQGELVGFRTEDRPGVPWRITLESVLEKARELGLDVEEHG